MPEFVGGMVVLGLVVWCLSWHDNKELGDD